MARLTLRRQTPFYAPARTATLSIGAFVMSAVVHQGRCPAALPAAARTIRGMSATVRPRTISASGNRHRARNGSGRRRPRRAFGFGLLVGRTSTSRHAVRSPERNCSSVEGLGAAASPATGRSAIATSFLSNFPDRLQQSNRGPAWRISLLPDAAPPQAGLAYRPAVADKVWLRSEIRLLDLRAVTGLRGKSG